MPTYVWSCLACGIANAATAVSCPRCGCPAKATLALLIGHRAEFVASGGELSASATHLHEPPELSAAEVLLPLFSVATLGLLPPIWWPTPNGDRKTSPNAD